MTLHVCIWKYLNTCNSQ